MKEVISMSYVLGFSFYFIIGSLGGMLYILFDYLHKNVFNRRQQVYEFSEEMPMPDNIDREVLKYNNDQESSWKFKK